MKFLKPVPVTIFGALGFLTYITWPNVWLLPATAASVAGIAYFFIALISND